MIQWGPFLVFTFPVKARNRQFPQSWPGKDMKRWMVKEGNDIYDYPESNGNSKDWNSWPRPLCGESCKTFFFFFLLSETVTAHHIEESGIGQSDLSMEDEGI